MKRLLFILHFLFVTFHFLMAQVGEARTDLAVGVNGGKGSAKFLKEEDMLAIYEASR